MAQDNVDLSYFIIILDTPVLDASLIQTQIQRPL